MGRNRFVDWTATPPARASVLDMVRRYVGGAGTLTGDLAPANDAVCCVVVLLLGPESHVRASFDDPAPQRGFEVWFHPDSVNIETRGADEFTDDVADSLALRLAHRWGGQIRDGVASRAALPPKLGTPA